MIEAVGRERVIDDLLKAFEIGGFTALKECDDTLAEFTLIVRFFQKAVALTDSGGFDDEISDVFEVVDEFTDLLDWFSEGFGRIQRVELDPPRAFFSAIKEFFEELFFAFIVAVQEMFEGADEADFVSGVKWGRCFEVALELEIGKEGVDDEWANIVRARELVSGDVKLTRLI